MRGSPAAARPAGRHHGGGPPFTAGPVTLPGQTPVPVTLTDTLWVPVTSDQVKV
jgi:hypothetical protein